jgi:hypothetical protein
VVELVLSDLDQEALVIAVGRDIQPSIFIVPEAVPNLII